MHFCSILSTKRAKINVNMVASRIFAATDAALKGAAMSWHSLSSKCSPVVAWLVVAACSIGDGGASSCVRGIRLGSGRAHAAGVGPGNELYSPSN